MQDIAIERMRSNAEFDAREVESQLRADMDKDQMERVLQDEEDGLTDNLLTIQGLRDIHPAASTPSVPQPTGHTGTHVAFSLDGPPLFPVTESRQQHPIDQVTLPFRAGNNQPGSSLAFQPFPPRNDVALINSMTTFAPAVSMPPNPLGEITRDNCHGTAMFRH